MRYSFLLFVFLLISIRLCAQLQTGEVPPGLQYHLPVDQVHGITSYVKQNKSAPPLSKPHGPAPAGHSVSMDMDFLRHANQLILPNGEYLWQLKLSIPGAASLGLVLSKLQLLPKTALYVYNPQTGAWLGAYTPINNNAHQLLSIQALAGDELLIEYKAPDASPAYLPTFRIDEMIYSQESSDLHDLKALGSSGPCQVNINCEEGSNWQDHKRAVVRIRLRQGSDWYWCTGSLINNSLQNQAPLLLTADHCGENASEADLQVWQFYFNYERPACANFGAPPSQVINGSSLISKAPYTGGTDFKLLQLNNAPPASWNPFFAGWSRATVGPESGVGIHHPSGDVKKISTFSGTVLSTTYPGGLAGGYWRVVWIPTVNGHGVTEGGSSGSPLFNAQGQIVGTLTGGSSGCNPDELTAPDIYGKLDRHWISNGLNSSQQLKPWLDPLGVDPMNLNGLDPNLPTRQLEVLLAVPRTGEVLGSGQFTKNQLVYVRAIANEGYTFQSWTDKQGNVLSTQAIYSFLMPDSNLALHANFRLTYSPEEHFAREGFSAYPNPTADYLLLDLLHPQELKYTLRIYNMAGQLVFSEEIPENATIPYRINLNKLNQGLYILHVATPQNTANQKIIIGRQE